jgi:PhzF family phenazine biosynthesis protein
VEAALIAPMPRDAPGFSGAGRQYYRTTMSVSFTWVDAFTDRTFGGNPAGVCLLNEVLPDAFMQSVAAELGIAETAFVVRDSGRADTFALRWFSPLVEIDLCGHATLATAHALRAQAVVDGTTPVTFHTRSGPLVASFAGDLIELDFPADPMGEMSLPDSLEGQWEAGEVAGTGCTGFFAVVVLTGAAAVRDYRPDLAAIAATGHKALLLTAPAEPGSGADYVLRVFGPNVGIDEDPATGSAQCALGPYWAAALGRSSVVARQLSPRGAVLHVRPDGARVHIAGNAVTVLTGQLRVK